MTRNGQVMFVDDEDGVRSSWQRYLQERGHTTSTAPDGATAIDQLSRQPVDVVVSDLRMPGKDGLELLEWLTLRQPTTRFIMLTGYGSKSLEGRVRELGGDYLEKPCSPEVLAHAVERALAADRLTRHAIEAPPLAEPVEEAVAQATAVEPTAAVEATLPVAEPSTAKTVGMVLAAPLLGLAFVVFLPVVGIGALAWLLGKELKSALWPART